MKLNCLTSSHYCYTASVILYLNHLELWNKATTIKRNTSANSLITKVYGSYI